MLHELEVGRRNPDGADQGFLVSYFPDLLDRPMFHPPGNGYKLEGTYRLPLGYQMDASYYCKRLSLSLSHLFPMMRENHESLRRGLGWCRPEAPVEGSVRAEQRDHLPQRAIAEALVLVVVACATAGPLVARAAPQLAGVRDTPL